MNLDKKLIALIVVTAAGIIGLAVTPYENSTQRYLFSGLGEFAIILAVAWIGYERVKLFGFRSALGRPVAFMCMGLLAWGMGELVWLYFNIIAKTEVPYPSAADVGYLALIPLSTYGMFRLLKNIKFEMDAKTKAKLFILPVLAFIFVYWLFISSKLAEDVPLLEKILNVAYPLGDAIILSFALTILSLSRGVKIFKPIVIISLGFLLLAVSDFSFSWTTSAGTYYTGSWVDILFSASFFVLGAGIHNVRLE